MNYEQQILGIWVDSYGTATWTFNANGTLSISNVRGLNYKYAVVGTKLATHSGIYDISISSDGKTLIGMKGDGNGLWLTKQ
jgi:hypothetical protein